MRREIFDVIEAARALDIQFAPTSANPRCVILGGNRSDFPDRLWRMAKALEAFDRLGAAAMEAVENPAPPKDQTLDSARLKIALDSVFRWMKSTGIDISDPINLVAEALNTVEEEKSSKGYRPIPKFAPGGFKKGGRASPLINLGPAIGEKVTWDSLKAKEVRAQMTEAAMGAAGPSSRLK
jgi:hypothetical protein